MKRLIFVLLSLITVLSSIHAQDFFETYDGDTIKKGDIIKIGYQPVISRDFLFIREKVNDNGTEKYLKITDTIAFTDIQIKDILLPNDYTVFGSKNTIVTAYSPERNKEYLIEIDNAISQGEVISRYVDHSSDKAVFLSDDLLLACCIKVNELTVDDRTVLFFISLKDEDLYEKCNKDEFEFHAVKDKYRQMLEDLISNFDFSPTYYIKNKIEIGKYDFEKKAYPLTYIHDVKKNFHKYGDYEFIITNPKFGEFVPVAQDEAQKCNKRRTGLSAVRYISPLAYGRIYFHVLDKKMELPKDKYQFVDLENAYRHKIIGVQLTKMEIFDYQHCDYNLIGRIE
ncbi:MAG: DUF4852 domain-containing protein [Suipraeoptans sp.]